MHLIATNSALGLLLVSLFLPLSFLLCNYVPATRYMSPHLRLLFFHFSYTTNIVTESYLKKFGAEFLIKNGAPY